MKINVLIGLVIAVIAGVFFGPLLFFGFVALFTVAAVVYWYNDSWDDRIDMLLDSDVIDWKKDKLGDLVAYTPAGKLLLWEDGDEWLEGHSIHYIRNPFQRLVLARRVREW